MGIEGFFKTVEKIPESGIIRNYNKKTNINFFYIDFNSILYNISGQVEDKLGVLLCDIVYGKKPDKKTCEMFDISDKITIEAYKDKFTKTSDQMDNIIIDLVLEYLEELFETFFDKNSFKKIYIAFDGIPEMGKIIEQKHRKYMAYVASELMKKIDSDNNISGISSRRKLVEDNRYRFDRTKLVTWSKFMKQTEDRLNEITFINKLKSKYPNLNSYIVSGSDEYGEGEKKIMEVIISEFKQNSGSYCVLSPDADLVLLTMILINIDHYTNNINNNTNNSVDVLHYNQETKDYSYVNTNKFMNFICKYVDRDLSQKHDIINDFILIATFIGNDFLPKIQSLNVKSDFNLLLDTYKKLDNMKNFIVKYNKQTNKFEINKNVFGKYIMKLAEQEYELVKHKYLMQNFDVHKIRRAFDYKYDSIYLVKRVEKYIDEYYEFISKITDKESIKKLISHNDPFIKTFKILEVPEDKNIYQHMTRLIYNKKTKPLFGVKISGEIEEHHMEKYLSNSLNKYHIDNDGFSEYDKNMIMFEWRLGKYKKMMNTYSDNDFDAYNSLANRLSYQKKEYSKTSYRDVYNNLYLHNLDNIDNNINEYIYGLYWVFDQYFNRNDKTDNYNKVSTWFYPYERAPLLIDISDKFKSFSSYNSDEHLIKRKEYMNKFEQLIYTMPLKKILSDDALSDRPKYKKFAKDHSEICPNLDEQINKIWENTETEKSFYIDCRRVTFITKCVLEKVENMSFDKFIKLTRSI